MGVRDVIVSYCKSVIGCSYDYTPSGGVEGESYNCSYLSTCAYEWADLSIPSWQGHQNGNGSQSDWVRWAGNWTTDPDELRPGDLVFFGNSPYDTFHVGVSLGGYRMIDSVPNGGVQQRTLYDTFVGGGWPLDRTSEEIDHDRNPDKDILEVLPMNVIITIPEKKVSVWLCNDRIHDLSVPADIDALDLAYAAGHDGKKMPRIDDMDSDTYARLCQACKAGYPSSLATYNDKYKPRP